MKAFELMAMLVGFHVEGWDFLLLRAFLAALLGLDEDEIVPDWIDQQGRGLDYVFDQVPKALHRFYARCAQFAVVGVDNDGDRNLLETGESEDAAHPRHWLHQDENEPEEDCRWCKLNAKVQQTRSQLTWLPQKPGADWPVLIVVPVEMIESWLLASEAIVRPGHGSMYAENERRSTQKQRFYGTPFPGREDVEQRALPLIREMTEDHLTRLRLHSNSFDQFFRQVDDCQDTILGPRDCWQEGDGGAVH